jgi:trehalose 6-phosphate phosphatase
MSYYLPDSWEEIASRAKTASRVFILLDYDGTLSPIALRPELALLLPRTKEILKKLSHCHNFELGIISGRSLADIKALIGLEGLAYAGNHGLELECYKGSFVHPVALKASPRLKALYHRLKEKLAGINGVIIEDKGVSLSVHYRLVAKSEVEKVKALFKEVVEASKKQGKVRVTEGKKVIDVRPPVDWDKGKAMEWLLSHYQGESPLVIFAGDDVTDEDGFKFVSQINGVSIRVGEANAATYADYYVRSPKELCLWLEKLAELGSAP